MTGTDVDVGGVDLALTSGRADLAGLTIDNPRGYETDYAVHIGHARVALDVGSLAGDVPVIEELTLDGALINAEQRDAASNLTDIQHHVSGVAERTPAREPGRIVIERFRLRNARVLLTSEYLERARGAAAARRRRRGHRQRHGRRDLLASRGSDADAGAGRGARGRRRAFARSGGRCRLSDAAREKLEDEELATRRADDVSERVDELLDRG